MGTKILCCRGNASTDILPSNDKGIHSYSYDTLLWKNWTPRICTLQPEYSCSTKFTRRLGVVWRPSRMYVRSNWFSSSSVQFQHNTSVCFNVHFFLFLHTHTGVFHQLFVTGPCSYAHIPEPVNTEPRCHLFFTMFQHCWSSAFSFVALFPL
jgi:hypothetical protein